VKATGSDFSYSTLLGADVRNALFTGSCFTGTRVSETFLEDIANADGAVDLDAA